jgi:hypothetical protein
MTLGPVIGLISRDQGLSRSPGRQTFEEFFVDPGLVEAACLTHDLGHSPFGHADDHPFKDADAHGVDLSGMKWDGEEFSGCNLRGTDLSRCTFAGAKSKLEKEIGMTPPSKLKWDLLKEDFLLEE